MARARPGVEAELLGGLELGGGGPAALAQRDEFLRGRIVLRRGLRDRVIRRHRHEARPEDRIGPRGVDRQLLAGRQFERELQPLRAADPVLLHQPDLVGPALELAQPLKQLLGEIGDLEEPLR